MTGIVYLNKGTLEMAYTMTDTTKVLGGLTIAGGTSFNLLSNLRTAHLTGGNTGSYGTVNLDDYELAITDASNNFIGKMTGTANSKLTTAGNGSKSLNFLPLTDDVSTIGSWTNTTTNHVVYGSNSSSNLIVQGDVDLANGSGPVWMGRSGCTSTLTVNGTLTKSNSDDIFVGYEGTGVITTVTTNITAGGVYVPYSGNGTFNITDTLTIGGGFVLLGGSYANAATLTATTVDINGGTLYSMGTATAITLNLNDGNLYIGNNNGSISTLTVDTLNQTGGTIHFNNKGTLTINDTLNISAPGAVFDATELIAFNFGVGQANLIVNDGTFVNEKERTLTSLSGNGGIIRLAKQLVVDAAINCTFSGEIESSAETLVEKIGMGQLTLKGMVSVDLALKAGTIELAGNTYSPQIDVSENSTLLITSSIVNTKEHYTKINMYSGTLVLDEPVITNIYCEDATISNNTTEASTVDLSAKNLIVNANSPFTLNGTILQPENAQSIKVSGALLLNDIQVTNSNFEIDTNGTLIISELTRLNGVSVNLLGAELKLKASQTLDLQGSGTVDLDNNNLTLSYVPENISFSGENGVLTLTEDSTLWNSSIDNFSGQIIAAKTLTLANDVDFESISIKVGGTVEKTGDLCVAGLSGVGTVNLTDGGLTIKANTQQINQPFSGEIISKGLVIEDGLFRWTGSQKSHNLGITVGSNGVFVADAKLSPAEKLTLLSGAIAKFNVDQELSELLGVGTLQLAKNLTLNLERDMTLNADITGNGNIIVQAEQPVKLTIGGAKKSFTGRFLLSDNVTLEDPYTFLNEKTQGNGNIVLSSETLLTEKMLLENKSINLNGQILEINYPKTGTFEFAYFLINSGEVKLNANWEFTHGIDAGGGGSANFTITGSLTAGENARFYDSNFILEENSALIFKNADKNVNSNADISINGSGVRLESSGNLAAELTIFEDFILKGNTTLSGIISGIDYKQITVAGLLKIEREPENPFTWLLTETAKLKGKFNKDDVIFSGAQVLDLTDLLDFADESNHGNGVRQTLRSIQGEDPEAIIFGSVILENNSRFLGKFYETVEVLKSLTIGGSVSDKYIKLDANATLNLEGNDQSVYLTGSGTVNVTSDLTLIGGNFSGKFIGKGNIKFNGDLTLAADFSMHSGNYQVINETTTLKQKLGPGLISVAEGATLLVDGNLEIRNKISIQGVLKTGSYDVELGYIDGGGTFDVEKSLKINDKLDGVLIKKGNGTLTLTKKLGLTKAEIMEGTCVFEEILSDKNMDLFVETGANCEILKPQVLQLISGGGTIKVGANATFLGGDFAGNIEEKTGADALTLEFGNVTVGSINVQNAKVNQQLSLIKASTLQNVTGSGVIQCEELLTLKNSPNFTGTIEANEVEFDGGTFNFTSDSVDLKNVTMSGTVTFENTTNIENLRGSGKLIAKIANIKEISGTGTVAADEIRIEEGPNEMTFDGDFEGIKLLIGSENSPIEFNWGENELINSQFSGEISAYNLIIGKKLTLDENVLIKAKTLKISSAQTISDVAGTENLKLNGETLTIVKKINSADKFIGRAEDGTLVINSENPWIWEGTGDAELEILSIVEILTPAKVDLQGGTIYLDEIDVDLIGNGTVLGNVILNARENGSFSGSVEAERLTVKGGAFDLTLTENPELIRVENELEIIDGVDEGTVIDVIGEVYFKDISDALSNFSGGLKGSGEVFANEITVTKNSDFSGKIRAETVIVQAKMSGSEIEANEINLEEAGFLLSKISAKKLFLQSSNNKVSLLDSAELEEIQGYGEISGAAEDLSLRLKGPAAVQFFGNFSNLNLILDAYDLQLKGMGSKKLAGKITLENEATFNLSKNSKLHEEETFEIAKKSTVTFNSPVSVEKITGNGKVKFTDLTLTSKTESSFGGNFVSEGTLNIVGNVELTGDSAKFTGTLNLKDAILILSGKINAKAIGINNSELRFNDCGLFAANCAIAAKEGKLRFEPDVVSVGISKLEQKIFIQSDSTLTFDIDNDLLVENITGKAEIIKKGDAELEISSDNFSYDVRAGKVKIGGNRIPHLNIEENAIFEMMKDVVIEGLSGTGELKANETLLPKISLVAKDGQKIENKISGKLLEVLGGNEPARMSLTSVCKINKLMIEENANLLISGEINEPDVEVFGGVSFIGEHVLKSLNSSGRVSADELRLLRESNCSGEMDVTRLIAESNLTLLGKVRGEYLECNGKVLANDALENVDLVKINEKLVGFGKLRELDLAGIVQPKKGEDYFTLFDIEKLKVEMNAKFMSRIGPKKNGKLGARIIENPGYLEIEMEAEGNRLSNEYVLIELPKNCEVEEMPGISPDATLFALSPYLSRDPSRGLTLHLENGDF
jgi:cytoskeletal protein CcmA (bactofilin family)